MTAASRRETRFRRGLYRRTRQNPRVSWPTPGKHRRYRQARQNLSLLSPKADPLKEDLVHIVKRDRIYWGDGRFLRRLPGGIGPVSTAGGSPGTIHPVLGPNMSRTALAKRPAMPDAGPEAAAGVLAETKGTGGVLRPSPCRAEEAGISHQERLGPVGANLHHESASGFKKGKRVPSSRSASTGGTTAQTSMVVQPTGVSRHPPYL